MDYQGELGGYTRTEQSAQGASPQTPPPPVEDWHYVEKGAQKGPVSTEQLQAMLAAKTIGPETQVWRPGFSEWKAIRFTELSDEVRDVPPPVAGEHVGNALVWILAFLPLVFGIFDAAIDMENKRLAIRTISLGFDAKQIPSIPFGIPFAINTALCLWDDRRLKRAGYNSRWMVLTALVLVPVYLFMRAKLLKQRPSYAITWIAMMLLGLLFAVSV